MRLQTPSFSSPSLPPSFYHDEAVQHRRRGGGGHGETRQFIRMMRNGRPCVFILRFSFCPPPFPPFSFLPFLFSPFRCDRISRSKGYEIVQKESRARSGRADGPAWRAFFHRSLLPPFLFSFLPPPCERVCAAVGSKFGHWAARFARRLQDSARFILSPFFFPPLLPPLLFLLFPSGASEDIAAHRTMGMDLFRDRGGFYRPFSVLPVPPLPFFSLCE